MSLVEATDRGDGQNSKQTQCLELEERKDSSDYEAEGEKQELEELGNRVWQTKLISSEVEWC